MKKVVLSVLIGLGLITTGSVKAEPMGKTYEAHNKKCRHEGHQHEGHQHEGHQNE